MSDGPIVRNISKRQKHTEAYSYYVRSGSPYPSENGKSAIYKEEYNTTLASSTTGYRNPKWRQQVRNEQNATTSYDWSYKSQNSSYWGDAYLKRYDYYHNWTTRPNSYMEHYWTGMYGIANAGDPGKITNSSHLTAADNQAKSRFLGKVRDDYNHFGGGVFLGELRETIRQLRKPYASAQRLLGGYLNKLTKVKSDTFRKYPHALAHKRIKDANQRIKANRELSKAVADTWLETSFGLMPLISDTREAAETLSRYVNGDEIVRTKVRGHGSKEAGYSGYYHKYRDQQYFYFTATQKTVETVRVLYNGGLRVRMHGAGNLKRDWIDLVGLAPRDFVPTVWNLLPWSWAVDYFLNVGEVLDAQWTFLGDVTWVSKTVSYHRDCRWTEFVDQDATLKRIWDTNHPSGRLPVAFDCSAYAGKTECHIREGNRRAVASSSLIPTLEFRALPLDSPVKATNLLAVFRKQLGGLQPFRF